jgi:hypothetical protein
VDDERFDAWTRRRVGLGLGWQVAGGGFVFGDVTA